MFSPNLASNDSKATGASQNNDRLQSKRATKSDVKMKKTSCIKILPPVSPRRGLPKFEALTPEQATMIYDELHRQKCPKFPSFDEFDVPEFIDEVTLCGARLTEEVFSLKDTCKYIVVICIDTQLSGDATEARCLPRCSVGKIYRADVLESTGFGDVHWFKLMGDKTVLMCLTRDEVGALYPGPCNVSGCIPGDWVENCLESDYSKYTVQDVKRAAHNYHNLVTLMFRECLGNPLQKFNGINVYAFEYFMCSRGLASTPAQFSTYCVMQAMKKNVTCYNKVWKQCFRSQPVHTQAHVDAKSKYYNSIPFK